MVGLQPTINLDAALLGNAGALPLPSNGGQVNREQGGAGPAVPLQG